jgi:hypothetical protein
LQASTIAAIGCGMAKYKRKAGVSKSLSKYFSSIGSLGGATVTVAKRESLTRLRALRKAKRDSLAATVGTGQANGENVR